MYAAGIKSYWQIDNHIPKLFLQHLQDAAFSALLSSQVQSTFHKTKLFWFLTSPTLPNLRNYSSVFLPCLFSHINLLQHIHPKLLFSHYLQHEKLLSDDLQGSALLVLQQFSPSIRSTFGNAASKHFCVLFHGTPHTQRHQKRRSNNNFSFKTTPSWQWQWHPAVSDDIWQLSLLRHWSRFCTDPQTTHKLLQQELGAPGWHSTGTALEVQLSSNC